jgi:hypothetical protein
MVPRDAVQPFGQRRFEAQVASDLHMRMVGNDARSEIQKRILMRQLDPCEKFQRLVVMYRILFPAFEVFV